MCVISVKPLNNICVIKTIKQFAIGVCSIIDKLNLVDVVGASCGDDSVMVYFPDSVKAINATNAIIEILG